VAQANAEPQIDLQAGLAAIEEDLPRVLRALDMTSIEDLGWTRPNKLTLLVPMAGQFQGKTEDFLLKLGFQAYRSWPPSAQFVNPETQHYVQGQDRHHIPILTSSECHTHPEYGKPGGGSVQLICCSATLEFYDVRHSVQPEHHWRDTFTFLTTINAIQRAFRSSFGGRF
jgi:hypothetical protein